VVWPLFHSTACPNAAHADPAMAARHDDTSWHHNCVFEDSPTWPGGGRQLLCTSAPSGTATTASSQQPFAGTFAHSLARQALCGGSLAAVKTVWLLIEAPVASRHASTTLPGYISPCSTGRAARGVVWLCHTKGSTVSTPGRSGALHLGLLPLTGPDCQMLVPRLVAYAFAL
jgi:hypothetical protein